MAPGRYPHLVSIEGPTYKKDDIGNQIPTFKELAKAWARIEPLRGREYFAAAQMQAETTHKITMRMPEIKVRKSYEIVFNTRRFKVESVLNTEEKDFELVIMCVEKEQPVDEEPDEEGGEQEEDEDEY